MMLFENDCLTGCACRPKRYRFSASLMRLDASTGPTGTPFTSKYSVQCVGKPPASPLCSRINKPACLSHVAPSNRARVAISCLFLFPFSGLAFTPGTLVFFPTAKLHHAKGAPRALFRRYLVALIVPILVTIDRIVTPVIAPPRYPLRIEQHLAGICFSLVL